MPNTSSRGGLFPGGLAAGIILSVVLLLWPVLAPVLAEDMPGLTDPRSPLVFPPLFRAELAASTVWYSLSSGKVTRDGISHPWELEKVFHFPHSQLFLDFMARLQAGRFSVRGYYEARNLSGEGPFQGDPAERQEKAEFSYPGVRIGGDMDLAHWNLSRVGFNVDYDLLAPSFEEGIETPGGYKMTGKQPLTVGIHGIYNPGAVYCGISPIFEVRARWPAAGAELTDVKVSAGVKAPETVLGSLAWRSGYRHTVLEFSTRHRGFDITLDGWFSELVYFY